MRYRALRYGFFVAGLVVAALSFLMCFGNALAGEGARDEVTRATFLGVVMGSAVAGGAVLSGAVMARRLVPLAAVIIGGLASALAGWSRYRMGVGESVMEWMLAPCIAPVGMWLGWLGGASGNRVVAGAALGGAVGAVLAELAFPRLFDRDVRPLNDDFWALSGLLVGGITGGFVGAFVGRSHGEKGRC
jgi:hypothetical protein